jgi:hypothetical protein
MTFTAPLPRQRLVVHLRYIAVPGGVRQEGETQRFLEIARLRWPPAAAGRQVLLT